MTYEKIGFIAPSTCLSAKEKPVLTGRPACLKKALGVRAVYFSPHLYSSDTEIDHVTAPVEDRAAVFKEAIRELDLIISVAGGTGAEDLVRKIDAKDLRVIRNRRPLFIGFSDFTFLLNEIYHACRVPVIYFPSLKVGKGDFRSLLALINGEEIHYSGAAWLTPPPPRSCRGSRRREPLDLRQLPQPRHAAQVQLGDATSFSSRTSRSMSRTSTVCWRPCAGTTSSPAIKGIVIGSVTPPGKGLFPKPVGRPPGRCRRAPRRPTRRDPGRLADEHDGIAGPAKAGPTSVATSSSSPTTPISGVGAMAPVGDSL